MTLRLLGKKKGMMQLFDKKGHAVPCTVIQADPNVITQIKTDQNDGYNALQLGFEVIEAKDPRRLQKRIGKTRTGHFAKSAVKPRRHLAESRVESVQDYELGQEFGVGIFEPGNFVDVTAISKGKGFQGVMKLYGYKGGPAAHGTGFRRTGGSIGMRSTPGRCFPGGKRPCHMGSKKQTIQSLEVLIVDEEASLIVVKGAVPGATGALVSIGQAKKKTLEKDSRKDPRKDKEK